MPFLENLNNTVKGWFDSNFGGIIEGIKDPSKPISVGIPSEVRNAVPASSEGSSSEEASAFGYSLDDLKSFSDYYNKQANEYARQNAQTAMDYNSREAQKQRDWEEMMSNTAVSRYVKDLEANGLNKILAYGGQASTPSGASASSSAATTFKNSEFSNSLGSTLREGLIESMSELFQASQNEANRSVTNSGNVLRAVTSLVATVLPFVAPELTPISVAMINANSAQTVANTTRRSESYSENHNYNHKR